MRKPSGEDSVITHSLSLSLSIVEYDGQDRTGGERGKVRLRCEDAFISQSPFLHCVLVFSRSMLSSVYLPSALHPSPYHAFPVLPSPLCLTTYSLFIPIVLTPQFTRARNSIALLSYYLHYPS